MAYDFVRCGWRIGPLFLRDETRFRICGWWPPERQRRKALALKSAEVQARRGEYLRGHRDGWEAYRTYVTTAFEEKFGPSKETQ